MKHLSHKDEQNSAANFAGYLKRQLRLLLQVHPCRLPQSQDHKTQSSLAMSQILPGKTPLTSRGLDGWLIRTVGFVSDFCLGSNAESPSGQWGWSGAVKAPGVLGGEQLWGWHWALGCPGSAAVGRSRNVGMALQGHGTPVPLGTRVLPLPFPPRGSQASRGQEGRDFSDSGVHWTFCLIVGWGKTKHFHLQI